MAQDEGPMGQISTRGRLKRCREMNTRMQKATTNLSNIVSPYVGGVEGLLMSVSSGPLSYNPSIHGDNAELCTQGPHLKG